MNQPEPNRYNGGQPESFKAVAEAGVRHVINLRPPEETPELNEPARVTAAGMAYYNIPVAGPADLSRDNVALYDRLLADIGDEPVLVHCASSNRVGAFAALRAAWLQGKSRDEALVIGENWGLTKMRPAVEQILDR